MVVLRWMIPVALFACLGGFIVGYLVPQWMPVVQGGMCAGGPACGNANGALITGKMPKPAINAPQNRPVLLTTLTGVKRGEPVIVEIQTAPGVVCAVSIGYVGQVSSKPFSLPTQFADKNGYCKSELLLPNQAKAGKGYMLVCANVCLDPEFFEIR